MENIAIVTGASRGIGAATAKLLANSGYAVCVNFHTNEDKANSLVKEIQQNNGKAIAVKANMALKQKFCVCLISWMQNSVLLLR